MTKTIILSQHQGNIYAEHYDENGKPEKEIIDLFGTHAIMTPWLIGKAKTEAGKCQMENFIIEHNPGVTVCGSYNAPTQF